MRRKRLIMGYDANKEKCQKCEKAEACKAVASGDLGKFADKKITITMQDFVKAFTRTSMEAVKEMELGLDEQGEFFSFMADTCARVGCHLLEADKTPGYPIHNATNVPVQAMAAAFDSEEQFAEFEEKLKNIHTEEGLQNLFEEYGIIPISDIGDVPCFGEGVQMNHDGIPPIHQGPFATGGIVNNSVLFGDMTSGMSDHEIHINLSKEMNLNEAFAGGKTMADVVAEAMSKEIKKHPGTQA